MEMTELTIEIPKSQIQECNNRPRIGLLSFFNSQLIHEFQLFKCQLEVQSRYHRISATTADTSACPRIVCSSSFRPMRTSHYHQPIPVPFGMASYEIGQPVFLPTHYRHANHPTSYQPDVITRAHIPFFHSNVFLPVLNHLY